MTREEAIYILRRFYADGYKSNNYNTLEQALQLAVMCLENLPHWISVDFPHWISVEDELPRYRQWVIVHTKHDDPAFYCTRYEGEELSWRLVSHWMPLPAPPESGSSENPNCSKKGGEG